jgi:hypothetical protein
LTLMVAGLLCVRERERQYREGTGIQRLHVTLKKTPKVGITNLETQTRFYEKMTRNCCAMHCSSLYTPPKKAVDSSSLAIEAPNISDL